MVTLSTRRALLGAVAAGLVGGAGCTEVRIGSPESSPGGSSPAGAVELVGTTFETSGGDDPSGTAEDAGITFDTEASTVVVDGEIAHYNVPGDARLKTARYDGASDTLVVRVVSYTPTPTDGDTPTSVGAATQVAYRFTGRFDGGLPGRVEVYHDDAEDPVNTAERDG